jgi:hypothetical protein
MVTPCLTGIFLFSAGLGICKVKVRRVMLRRDEKTSHNSLLYPHFRALGEPWLIE